MNITLKNIKHIPRLSEETECFTASIYIDGVKKGEASNRGCGGCTDIHPRELAESIHNYAKTLPPFTVANRFACTAAGPHGPKVGVIL